MNDLDTPLDENSSSSGSFRVPDCPYVAVVFNSSLSPKVNVFQGHEPTSGITNKSSRLLSAHIHQTLYAYCLSSLHHYKISTIFPRFQILRLREIK